MMPVKQTQITFVSEFLLAYSIGIFEK